RCGAAPSVRADARRERAASGVEAQERRDQDRAVGGGLSSRLLVAGRAGPRSQGPASPRRRRGRIAGDVLARDSISAPAQVEPHRRRGRRHEGSVRTSRAHSRRESGGTRLSTQLAWPKGAPHEGQVAQRSRKILASDIARFTEISGDRNPIHYDAALAAATKFGGIVVQGGVTSAILNALVAEDLPGPGTVFLSVNWNFKAPV